MRLGARTDAPGSTGYLFQFQLGAIGRLGGSSRQAGMTGFNSSLVRLGAELSEKIAERLGGFNSSLVRLGECIKP